MLLLALLLLSTSVFVRAPLVPSAHAAGFTGTGIVCITSSTTASNCDNSAPSIGPLTVGQTVSVGVFVNNSMAMNGFDIFVAADPSVLSPTSASLGGLIHNPTATTICVNDKSVQGTCGATPPSGAEGPGVVEVATFDGTGNNDCNGVPATAPPCSGMAFTITYSVVGPGSSSLLSYPSGPACSNSSVSSPANICVLISDNIGNTLAENIQGATVVQQVVMDPTMTSAECSPNTVVVDQATLCTATVTDTASSGATAPTGTVTWTSGFFGFPGFFGPNNPCTVQSINTFQSSCSTFFTPTFDFAEFPGIYATYSGDATHSGSDGIAFLSVVLATPSLSTTVTVDRNNEPPPSGGVPVGNSVHDDAQLFSGDPFRYIAGSVTYTFFTNGACSGTGTVISNVPVGPLNVVPSSGSVTPAAAGDYSFMAMYSGDPNDNPVSSACESFVVNNYDFSLSAPAASVGPGLFSDVNITVTGLNDFCSSGACLVGFIQPALPSGVMVQLVPNPVTVTSVGGSATATLRIFATAAVPAGTFTIVVKADWEGLITHDVSITVHVTGAPAIITKVNWNHELSLSLDGPQKWHFFITNPETSSINVVFRITGKSTTNPANSFDITCGKTCVNTDRHGVNSTPGLTPILISALTTPMQIKVSYTLDPAFVGQQVKFTATLWITTSTGTFYQPTNSFSGTFFVLP